MLTHHGWFRGAGLAIDADDAPAYQDPTQPQWLTCPDRFAALTHRLGPYTLALAESLVRLADWHESRLVSGPSRSDQEGPE